MHRPRGSHWGTLHAEPAMRASPVAARPCNEPAPGSPIDISHDIGPQGASPVLENNPKPPNGLRAILRPMVARPSSAASPWQKTSVPSRGAGTFDPGPVVGAGAREARYHGYSCDTLASQAEARQGAQAMAIALCRATIAPKAGELTVPAPKWVQGIRRTAKPG